MMLKFAVLVGLVCVAVVAESTVNGVKATNVLGGSEQHASFSFVRPGLTQTSYAFNGPSSHQSFSSSIGNPHLAHKVLPNVANALAYRNPGLGYFPTGPVTTGYANSPYAQSPGVSINSSPFSGVTVGFPYQQQPQFDRATALAYLQQYQQQQHHQQHQQNYHGQIHSHDATEPTQQTYNPEIASYQAQLGQIFALRQQQALLQLQSQAQSQHHQFHGQTSDSQQITARETSQEVPEQAELQQQVQQPRQNLLGVAYSSAPSVAHVKVTGNGYKFNF